MSVKSINWFTFIFNKQCDFSLQSAYDKCFWQAVITNSKWLLPLISKARSKFKVLSRIDKPPKKFANPSQILWFEGRKTGRKSRLRKGINSRSNSTCIYVVYTQSWFWRTHVFFNISWAYLSIMKQELTEHFWPCKYTY